jgi:phosphoserine phosphatase
VEDLLDLCRELNARKANYVVIGGFAIRAAGYIRDTMDIDLLVETDLENESRVYKGEDGTPRIHGPAYLFVFLRGLV